MMHINIMIYNVMIYVRFDYRLIFDLTRSDYGWCCSSKSCAGSSARCSALRRSKMPGTATGAVVDCSGCLQTFCILKKAKWAIFNHFSVATWFCCDFPLMTHYICSCDARFFGAPQDPCRLCQGTMTINNEYREYERKHLEPVKRSTASCTIQDYFSPSKPSGFSLLEWICSTPRFRVSSWRVAHCLERIKARRFECGIPMLKKPDIEHNLSRS